MLALAPIKLTLYDLETFEAHAEYICNFVPLRYLKLAMQLSQSLVNINADTLAGLIVDLFGRQFSVDELMKYTEQSDRMAVLEAIMLRPGLIRSKASRSEPEGETTDRHEYELKDMDWIIDMEVSLTSAFVWSLRELDDTYIESLLPFIAYFAGTAGEAAKTVRVYADQVNWL